MTLNGSLQVGRSALIASQAALQVAGNNMANVGTAGFHRRTVHLTPVQGELVGRSQYIGRGVQISSIHREIDTALQARFRDAVSDEQAGLLEQRFLTAIETIQGELTDNDLSSLLSTFFNGFSEAANNPTDDAVRSVVIQQGESLVTRIADMQRDYTQVRDEIDRSLTTAVETVNDLLDQIAALNTKIALAEPGVGEASSLRDQRDLLVDQLSEFIEVDVIEHGTGAVDILVNSTPILLGGRSRGVKVDVQSVGTTVEVKVRVAEDGTHLVPETGRIGALLKQRDTGAVGTALTALDTFATELIHQVNRLHAQGQGEHGFESAIGTNLLNDPTANLNAGDANLPFRTENGSFFIHMTHQSTGQRTSYRIDVDGDAMSAQDLLDEINLVVAVPNLNAGLTVDRAVSLTADAGYEVSFSEDTSGVLTALGINTFFTGKDANTIGVNDVLLDDPAMLALGDGHVPGSNGTALAIANLQDEPVDELNGASLRGFWQSTVNDLAVQTGAASNAAESALVRESLGAQIQSVSGVSLDEESINLLTYQRQFQAAARFITVIDEALQILLSIA